MAFDVFVNFNGNCKEAVEFYAEVFKADKQEIMTYGQNPGGCPDNRDENRILYTFLQIFGCNMMFSDCPSAMEFVQGNNIGMSIGIGDQDEITRIFNELSEGGTVQMPLGKTFFNELYGMVTDKFGILWHISHAEA